MPSLNKEQGKKSEYDDGNFKKYLKFNCLIIYIDNDTK